MYKLILLLVLLSSITLSAQTAEQVQENCIRSPKDAGNMIAIAIRQDPNNPLLHFLSAKNNIAKITSNTKDIRLKASLESINLSLAAYPNNPFIYEFKAKVLRTLAEDKTSKLLNEQAFELTTKAFELLPTNKVIAGNYAHELLKRNRPNEAWLFLEELYKKNIKDQQIASLASKYYLETKQFNLFRELNSKLEEEYKKNLSFEDRMKVMLGEEISENILNDVFAKDYVAPLSFPVVKLENLDALNTYEGKTGLRLYELQLKVLDKNKIRRNTKKYISTLIEVGEYSYSIKTLKGILKNSTNAEIQSYYSSELAQLYKILKAYDLSETYFKHALKYTVEKDKRPIELALFETLIKAKKFPEAKLYQNQLREKYKDLNNFSHFLDEYWWGNTEHFNKWANAYRKAKKVPKSTQTYNHRYIIYNHATTYRLYGPIPVSKKSKKSGYSERVFVENCYLEAHVWHLFDKQQEFDAAVKIAKESSSYNIRHQYFDALFNFKNGNIETAEVYIESYLKSNPIDTDALTLAGMIHLQKNEFDEANKFIDKIGPKKEKNYLKLTALVTQGRILESITFAEEILKTTKDERVIILLHSLTPDSYPDRAQILAKNIEWIQSYPYIKYYQFEIDKIDQDKLLAQLNRRIYMRPKIFLYQGIKSYNQKKMDLAKTLLKNCLHPKTIDFPEHQMARGILKLIEKN